MEPQSSSLSILILAFTDAITTLTALSVCYRCATLFYTRILFRETTPRHPSVRRLFSITFTLSLSLLLLIIFEPIHLMQHPTRRLHWLFDVYALLILLVFVLPTAQVYHILIDRGWKMLDSLKASLVCEMIFLWIFWRVGEPFGKNDARWWKILSVDEGMGRILIVGTTMLAILSGFTAVNLPYMYLGFVLKPMKESEVLKLERRLMACVEEVRQQKMVMLRGGGNRILVASPSLVKAERQAEMAFLTYNEACHAWKSVVFSKTKLGRFFTLLGAVMLLLCAVRVCAAVYNISNHLFWGKRRSDSGAEIILHRVLMMVGIHVDEQTLYEYATLAITSVLIAVNMRAALMRMMSVFSLVSTNDILSSSAAVFLALLMGTYVISSTVLIRGFLPHHTRLLIRDVMGKMEFQFFQRWFDVLFLGSVIVSSILLARDSASWQKLQRQPQRPRPKRVSIDQTSELPFIVTA